MSWTNESSTFPNSWGASAPGVVTSLSSMSFIPDEYFEFMAFAYSATNRSYPYRQEITSVERSYNIPGFDDGYQPEGVNNPIRGDLGGGEGGGGGGPTRPTSGFLYPRGQG